MISPCSVYRSALPCFWLEPALKLEPWMRAAHGWSAHFLPVRIFPRSRRGFLLPEDSPALGLACTCTHQRDGLLELWS
jgi:hypothetical protein